MTEQTDDPAHLSDVSVPAQTNQYASVEWHFSRVFTASRAVKLALEAAEDEPRQNIERTLSPPQMFENWRATNMLVHAALNNLDAEVLSIQTLLRGMLWSR